MTEKIIFLEDIDPVVLLGPNNRLLDQIQSYFPKIKIIARGSEIKCIGDPDEVNIFVDRIAEINDYYRRYNRLEESD